MWIVGLTGGIGSGKSEAARLFSALGVPVVDVDKISHEITSSGHPVLQQIAQQFGAEFLNVNGELNRAALREKIFSDKSAKQALEAILHPAIYEQVIAALDTNKNAPYQIIDIPLLFESDRYLKLINRSLVIDCEPALQIARTKQRSGLRDDAIQKIIDAQIPRVQRNQLADDVIFNNGSIKELDENVHRLHLAYSKACINKQSKR